MKRRKTAILLALSLGITAAFTACGGSSQGSSAQAESEAAEQTEDASQAEAADQAEASDQAQPAETADAEQAQATDQLDAEAAGADQALNQAGSVETPEAPAAPAPAAQPNADKFHVELQKVGRVSGKSNYRVTYDSLVQIDGDHYTFCDFKGNPVDDRQLLNMEYLGWDLYSVTVQIEGDVNSTGLVTTDGEVLIPFNAAIIEFPSDHSYDERPRYVLVLTGTEQTTNQEEALFYVTENQFSITASDDDIFFKGNLKIFDLETKQYVNGLEFTKGSGYDFAQVGDNILADVGDNEVVYSPDGKAVYTAQGSLYYNRSYMADRIDSETVIMDANGTKIYTTDSILNTVGYGSENFLKYKDGKYTVINAKGETVLNGEWPNIYGEDKGRFRVKNDGDDDYTLVAADNSVIAKGPYMLGSDPLGFIAFGENKNYSVVTPGNRVIEGIERDSASLVYTKDDASSYLILNTGEFASADGNYLDEVGKGVVGLQNSEGKTSLVDVFTGQELIGFKYDEVDDLNSDYIYYEDGDDIVILKVVVVPES